MKVAAFLAVMAMAVSGCACVVTCPVPSSAWLAMQELPQGEQNAFLRGLTVEERLDAYHDVYVRSGHPKIMRSRIFEGAGEEAFDAVIGRMTDRSSFHEYFWIINWLGKSGELDICAPRYFQPLSAKVDEFATPDRNHPVPISFGDCEVVL